MRVEIKSSRRANKLLYDFILNRKASNKTKERWRKNWKRE
jgi:hypothetical protein